MQEFRNLRADEVECRVQHVTEKGAVLLLYKDARCDMNILDEVVGAMNWKREHREINGKMFCSVSVFDKEKGEWISKEDVGTESYTEKEKGQSSDSFKRACFNWGIGRELYTAPFIWIPADKIEVFSKAVNGKTVWGTRDKFSVSNLRIEDGKITGLAIKSNNNKIVYLYDEKGK